MICGREVFYRDFLNRALIEILCRHFAIAPRQRTLLQMACCIPFVWKGFEIFSKRHFYVFHASRVMRGSLQRFFLPVLSAHCDRSLSGMIIGDLRTQLFMMLRSWIDHDRSTLPSSIFIVATRWFIVPFEVFQKPLSDEYWR